MATFVKLHSTQREDADGNMIINTRNHTAEEITEMRSSDPSAFITVPESHAADVIRPQMRYQEVEDVQTTVPADSVTVNVEGNGQADEGAAGTHDDKAGSEDVHADDTGAEAGAGEAPVAAVAKPRRKRRAQNRNRNTNGAK